MPNTHDTHGVNGDTSTSITVRKTYELNPAVEINIKLQRLLSGDTEVMWFTELPGAMQVLLLPPLYEAWCSCDMRAGLSKSVFAGAIYVTLVNYAFVAESSVVLGWTDTLKFTITKQSILRKTRGATI